MPFESNLYEVVREHLRARAAEGDPGAISALTILDGSDGEGIDEPDD